MDDKVLKYRSSHPKCIYCKYLKIVVPSIDVDPYYKCLAKDKIIHFPDIIRICSCYDIEGGRIISGTRNTFDYDYVLNLCEDPNSHIPSLKAQDAVNELCRYFLGEDWYDDTLAISNSEVNFHIVCEIESKYKGCKTKKKR